MCKNIVELDRPRMTIWCMPISCWVPQTTNTHSDYTYCFSTATMVARTSLMLCYAYIACLVYPKLQFAVYCEKGTKYRYTV